MATRDQSAHHITAAAKAGFDLSPERGKQDELIGAVVNVWKKKARFRCWQADRANSIARD